MYFNAYCNATHRSFTHPKSPYITWASRPPRTHSLTAKDHPRPHCTCMASSARLPRRKARWNFPGDGTEKEVVCISLTIQLRNRKKSPKPGPSPTVAARPQPGPVPLTGRKTTLQSRLNGLAPCGPTTRGGYTPPSSRLIRCKYAPDRVQRSRCGAGRQVDY